ncbi:PTS sugar transporter subunit IIA [Candidatus Sumerlaeota bacterium]|nr:PTS sugar transporter subunit IIA [Candidatus Sumerlaeota bacterium]MBI3736853.1 PTS sugar transporter subunit IIA [Candidatus Sumerlaeota bacterium]
MKLSSLFQEEHILVHPQSMDFTGSLLALMSALKENLGKVAPEEIAKVIVEREQQSPSVVDDDVCLSHSRMEGIPTFQAALAILKDPVPHPSNPNIEIKLLFLILAPQEQNTLMIQTLAALSRLLGAQNVAQGLRGSKSAARIIKLIEESGIEVKRNLTVRDIMEPVTHSVQMDNTLHEAVEVLTEARDEGVPVLDEKGRLVGEITTREILLLGMPKYMDLLANPEMLNAFEPFESFFREENKTHVRDICRRDFVTAEPSDLVVRVAHQMITANRRRIYVLDDEKVIGIVYRKSIVERVLHR